MTWRNPPSNPPGSYLSSGGGPRRRRRAAAGAAGAAQGAAGILQAAGWDGVGDPDCGCPEPRFSLRGGKACESGGLPGDVPPTVALGSLRFGAPAGHRVCPSALPAPEHSGMPEENLAAESGSPRDRSAARSSGPGRGRPLQPPLAGEESGGCGAPSSPPPRAIAPRNPLPRPDPRGRTAAREGEGARPGQGIFDVSLWEAVDFHMVEGGGRACAQSWESGLPRPPRGCRAATRDRGCSREGSLGDRLPLPPPGPLGDTPRPPLATSARHVLPPRPAPWAPPGLGAGTGGRGWTRRARRLQARAGERGAAGSRGRPGACGPAERGSVGQARGAPLPGVGRPGDPAGGIRAPRRRAGWAGRGDRLVRMAGWNELSWEGPVSPRGKWGPGLCPPSVPSARPREPGGLCERPGRPGWAAGRRRWPGAFPE